MFKIGLAPLLMLGSFLVHAKPVVPEGGAVSVASFLLAGLPNGSIAQGSMFTVFGAAIGPAQLAQATAFPLPASLGGVSIRVVVGGTGVDCLMAFVIGSQVAAILPSSTPTGTGTLTLTFNGEAADPIAIRVVRSSFGTFTRNSAGSGPASVQNFVSAASQPLNAIDQAINPGGVVTLWGTGLGPVAGDEAGEVLPGDLTDIDVKVYVGGIEAEVLYRGRSGCCAGIDQIVFRIPPGALGCAVPVIVVIDGLPSNSSTISIAASGTICSDANGLTAEQIQTASAANAFRSAVVNLRRENRLIPAPAGLPPYGIIDDRANGAFRSFTLTELQATQSIFPLSGDASCSVTTYRGVRPSFTDSVPGAGLDAGTAINIDGPAGARAVPKLDQGFYEGYLGGGGLAIPGLPGGGDPDFLEPGGYTADNGGGGAQVPAFVASGSIAAPATSTNLNEIAVIDRGQSLTVTWSGDFAASAQVNIEGSSTLVTREVGAAFQCRVPAAAGSFELPAYLLMALPASEVQEGAPTGTLAVGTVSPVVRFSVAGLDGGWFTNVSMDRKPVRYE